MTRIKYPDSTANTWKYADSHPRATEVYPTDDDTPSSLAVIKYVLSKTPKINGVALAGDKTAAELGLATDTALNTKQDALTAGDNITIENNVISATGGGGGGGGGGGSSVDVGVFVTCDDEPSVPGVFSTLSFTFNSTIPEIITKLGNGTFNPKGICQYPALPVTGATYKYSPLAFDSIGTIAQATLLYYGFAATTDGIIWMDITIASKHWQTYLSYTDSNGVIQTIDTSNMQGGA